MMDVLKYDDDLSLKRDFDKHADDREAYDEWHEWAHQSELWSKSRRSRITGRRRACRAFLALAVVGLLILAKYCTYSTPYEHWYVGLIGIVFVVPIFVYLIERSEDAR